MTQPAARAMAVGMAAALFVLPSASSAEPSAGSAEPSADQDEIRPVSGVRVEPESEGEGLLWTQRALLFLPRVAFNVLTAPPRLALWVSDRFSVQDQLERAFFNRAGNFGIYPLVNIESGFGPSIGGVITDRDHLPQGIRVKGSARFGGRSTQTYQLELKTFELVRNARLRVLGRYEHRTRDRFYGIGNRDRIPVADVTAPADPRDVAARADYRHRDIVGAMDLELFRSSPARLEFGTRLLRRSYNPEGSNDDLDVPAETVYDVSSLTAYEQGLVNVYTSIAGTLDYRRIVADYNNPPVYAAGWRAKGTVGYAWGVGDAPSRHGRYDLDLQKYINLYRGDRVLVIRASLHGVIGKASRIPFDALPFLGGRRFLRGYPSQRFRDRVSALATLEYQYPVNHYLASFLFTDAGRVYRSIQDMSMADLRIGFGGGLDYRSSAGSAARLSLSSSIDGGLFLNLGFEATLDVNTR